MGGEGEALPSRARSIVRTVLGSAVAITVYYLVPVDAGSGPVGLTLRVLACLAGLVLVTWLILRQVRRQLVASDEARLESLLLAILIGVLFLALADHVLAQVAEGQFVGLQTKTDALYFAVSTLVTVGFGDVHAVGQVARVLVMVQMLFNIVVITTAASLFGRRVREIRAGRGGVGPPQSDGPSG